MVLEQVEKRFDDTRVIEPLDLTVNDGEFVVFVGPSGCGKTTLLRMIAGLESVSAGEIHVGGRTVTMLPPVERGVSMVFQNYALYPHLTVEENIGFGLMINGVAKAERRERVLRAARTLQLENYLKRKPRALSGGQRQRVAIGRAIVKEPGIFLFDEPLSNLDAELRVQMRLEIAKLHQELGATMIYVTHDQVEAMTLADRIVVLRGGRIEQVGGPIELYENPANLFVAGFIGSPKMNFAEGRIAAESGGVASVAVPTLGSTPVEARVAARRAADTVTVGFRPEHIRVGDGPYRARVELVERLGNVSYAYAVAEGGARITIERRQGVEFRVGETVALRLDPATTLVFGSDGARV